MDTLSTPLYFDPFAMSPSVADQTFASDFSPVSLFGPFSEDYGADFTSDSAGSPASPVSPVLSSQSFAVPTSDDFGSWDNIDDLSEPDFFKVPFPGRTATPAVNPMDLTLQPPMTGYPTDLQGPSGQTPLFQSPQPAPAALPTMQPLELSPSILPTAPNTQQPRQSIKRNSVGGVKRKSSPTTSEQEQNSPKRSSTSPSPATQQEPHAPLKKTAHNMIEKRYRTNLNDKIAQLREAIPSLRAGTSRFGNSNFEDGEDGVQDDDFSSLVPVPKLNKATILSKATEYILQLEQRNRNLETENNAIRGRMEGLEMLMMTRGGRTNTAGWN